MLTKNWAITPTFDRELKHYQLLGYIQRVEQHFEQYRLYPYLSELREDHSELLELRKRKEELQRTVRGVLTGFDVRAGEALHEALPLPGPFDVIEDLLDKAIPRLAHVLEHGIQLQHELLGVVHGLQVGLQPLDLRSGWMLLRTGKEARVYAYSIPWVLPPERSDTRSFVRTRFVTTYSLGIGHTYDLIREDLQRTFRALPVAATFAMECEQELPRFETLLPLARQRLHSLLFPSFNSLPDPARPS
jgi:hypothetical protein